MREDGASLVTNHETLNDVYYVLERCPVKISESISLLYDYYQDAALILDLR